MLIFLVSTLCFVHIHGQETLEPRVIKKVVDQAYVKDHDTADLIVCNRVDTMLGITSDRGKKKALSNILGRTHDILTDISYYHILTQSYSNCQKTPDFKFFVPNNYMVEMVMDREFHKTMTVTESFEATSNSAKIGAGLDASSLQSGNDVAGQASAEAQASKTELTQNSKTEFSINVGNKMYRLVSDLKPEFTQDFKNRIVPIVDYIEQKLYDRARQLVERVIVDYGTHVTTEAIVGTRIAKKVYIEQSLTKETTKFSASARASARAELEKGGGALSGQAKYEQTDEEGEIKKTMEITVFLQGGSEFKQIATDNITALLNDDKPVALSRKVQPIYLFMDSGSLNNCSSFASRMLRQFFEDAIDEYLERNTYRGCTDNRRPNFDFQANVDDNTCLKENCTTQEFKCKAVMNPASITLNEFLNCLQNKNLLANSTGLYIENCRNFNELKKRDFGGMYQECNPTVVTRKHHDELKKFGIQVTAPCDGLETQNIKTQELTCPSNKKLLIHSYIYARPVYEVVHHDQLCDGGIESDNCTNVRAVIVLRDKVNLTSFWCGSDNDSEDFSYVYFAGYFDYGQVNNFNLRRECPRNTFAVNMFHATTFCIYVNLQNDRYHEHAQLTRVYSSKTQGARCRLGHSRQLITVLNDNTKIYACILKNQAYYDLPFPALIKGPYMNIETLDKSEVLSTFITIYVNGLENRSTTLASIGHAFKPYYDDVIRNLKAQQKSRKEGELKSSTAVLLSFFSSKIVLGILVAVLVFFCIFIAIQCHRTRQAQVKKSP